MKLMITVNVNQFVNEYNRYAKAFGLETMDLETVYKALDDTSGVVNYIISKPQYVVMTSDEIEKFAEMLDVEGCKEIALDMSSRVWFTR